MKKGAGQNAEADERWVYVMKARTLTRLIRAGKATCKRCGLQFKVGDRVTGRLGISKPRYHEACMEETRL